MAEKKKLTFEQAMQQLELLVQSLEKGDVPLEKSLSLFEEATALVKTCQQQLDRAEAKVKILSAGPEGELTEEDFVPEEPDGTF